MPLSAAWSVLFVQSASPGAVFRFLERRQRSERQATGSKTSAETTILFLSDALSGNNWRALTGEREFLRTHGAALSRAFPPSTLLLYQQEQTWGVVVWEQGDETQREENPLPPLPRSWKNFFGKGRLLPPPALWAAERKLPLSRVPGAIPGARAVPVIEYRTVSGLDQRDLLVETGPRLYRFEWLLGY